MLHQIPAADHAAYAEAPELAREDIARWLHRLAPAIAIFEAKRAGEKPGGTIGVAIRAIAKAHGISKDTVQAKFYAWRNRGWRGLWDKRKFPENGSANGPENLPAPFVEFWLGLLEKHQRGTSGKAAHAALISRWLSWQMGHADCAIPGFDRPPEAAPGYRHPGGWSYRNLMNLAKRRLHPYQLLLRRQGRKAASQDGALGFVRTTRAGLQVLERVFFDDQEYDTKVVAPGFQNKPMRPMGFNALDHLTGKFVHYAIKLTRWDGDAGMKRQLNQADFCWFALSYLCGVGYRTDAAGTALIGEHGTAAFPENFARAIEAYTGGKVRTIASGKFNSPMFAGMLFRPQSTGNYRFKAPLESLFNLVRNRFASLPGPTGRKFDLKPEEQHGQDRYAEQMLKIYDRLPEEVAQWLEWDHLTFNEFLALAHQLYHAIDTRADHALEGWAKCGFAEVQHRFAPDMPFMPRAQIEQVFKERNLDATERRLYKQIACLQQNTQLRKLSPEEAFRRTYDADRKAGIIKTLPVSAVSTLMGRRHARPVKVSRQGEIAITDRMIAEDKLLFRGEIHDPADPKRRPQILAPGDEVLAWLNPYSPQAIILGDNDGRFLGLSPAIEIPCANGTVELLRSLGRQNQAARDLAISPAHRAAGITAERRALKDNNDQILRAARLLPERASGIDPKAPKPADPDHNPNPPQIDGSAEYDDSGEGFFHE